MIPNTEYGLKLEIFFNVNRPIHQRDNGKVRTKSFDIEYNENWTEAEEIK
jgi:hypothetical protein